MSFDGSELLSRQATQEGDMHSCLLFTPESDPISKFDHKYVNLSSIHWIRYFESKLKDPSVVNLHSAHSRRCH